MKTSAFESDREWKLEWRLFQGGKPRRATYVHSPEPQIGVPAGSILVRIGTAGITRVRGSKGANSLANGRRDSSSGHVHFFE
jgi:hypothetical protein